MLLNERVKSNRLHGKNELNKVKISSYAYVFKRGGGCQWQKICDLKMKWFPDLYLTPSPSPHL